MTYTTKDGIVAGTSGDNEIKSGYVDANGDRIDGNDAILPGEVGDDDIVDAGAGNDTIEAGEGNDVVYAGSGDDSVDGGAGDDLIYGDSNAGGGIVTADLIVNGSFEDTTGMTDVVYGHVATGSMVGWNTLDPTHEIDVHDDGRGGVAPADGSNWLDLEASPGDIAAYQDVQGAIDGEDYTLTFYAGDSAYVDNNCFDVYWGGVKLASIDPPAGTMQEYTFTVVGGAGDGSDRLMFVGHGPDDKFGASIDAVSLTGPTLLDSDGNQPGDDTLLGGEGDDTIFGEGGNDLIDGGAGNDVLYGDSGSGSTVTADLVVNGSFEDTSGMTETYYGFVATGGIVGWNTLDPTHEIDVHDDGRGGVAPADGNNWLDLEATPGDIAAYQDIQGAIGGEDYTLTFYAGDMAGADNNCFDVYWGGVKLASIDPPAGTMQEYTFTVSGGAGDGSDRLMFVGHGPDDNFGASIDAVSLTGPTLVDGEGGNDTIIGGAGDDLIHGEGGDDVVCGDDGNDLIYGGAGDDTIHGGEGNDTIHGGDGNDLIYGDGDACESDGTSGDLFPEWEQDISNVVFYFDADGDGEHEVAIKIDEFPDSGTPTHISNDLDDFYDQMMAFVLSEYPELEDASAVLGVSIKGGTEPTQFFAVDGDSNGPIADPGPILNTGPGTETLLYSDFYATYDPDASGGGSGAGGSGTFDDLIYGGTGDDTIYGGEGSDTVHGDAGDDVIDGGTGDDLIAGGSGNDTMTGGDDRDLFIEVNAGDVVYGGEGGDDWDTLDLTGSAPENGSLKVTYTTPDKEDGFVSYFDENGDPAGTLEFFEIEKVIPCFTPGTMIATPKGERAVEELEPGDRVITRDNGIQEIRWVGRKPIAYRDLALADHLKPVLIRAGALGNGLPERDMMVSPNHRVLVANDRTALYFDEREVLAAAKHLVDHKGVKIVEPLGVTYIHFMFDHHEVVLSDGAWTESFQPGDHSLKAIGNSQRQELFELFPELETTQGVEDYVAARRILKKHEARMLVK